MGHSGHGFVLQAPAKARVVHHGIGLCEAVPALTEVTRASCAVRQGASSHGQVPAVIAVRFKKGVCSRPPPVPAAARTIEPGADPAGLFPWGPKFFALPSLSYVAVPWRRNPCGLAYIGQQEVQMLFSMSEAAKATGVAPYRIKYALQTRRLPEPGRVGGRRVFGPDDVELIRRHFAAAAGVETARHPRQDRNRK